MTTINENLTALTDTLHAAAIAACGDLAMNGAVNRQPTRSRFIVAIEEGITATVTIDAPDLAPSHPHYPVAERGRFDGDNPQPTVGYCDVATVYMTKTVRGVARVAC